MNAAGSGPQSPESHFWDRLPQPLAGLRALIAGLALTSLITFVGIAFVPWLPSHGVAMLYLLAVVGGAVAFGMTAGLSTAVLSFLAYNFFFLAPTYTFAISNPRDLLALFVYFCVAAATGSLAGRLREVAERARTRTRSLQSLNVLAARLAGAASFAAVAEALACEAAEAMSGQAVVINITTEGLAVAAHAPGEPVLNTADWQAAQRSVSTRVSVYPAAPGWPGATYAFYPVLVRGMAAATLGVKSPAAGEGANDATLSAMAQNAAITLERLSLERENASVQKEAELERFRSALLSSVSHDIKTPLASIQGAVTSLRELGTMLPEEDKADLLLAIEEEAQRLSRFVTNLLDMARLESGTAAIPSDWVDLEDIVAASVARARNLIPEADIRLQTSAATAIVRVNETLLEHVILNIIENAVKFSPPGAPIRVAITQAPDRYEISVEDEGKGISREDLPKIFEKFYRGEGAAARGSGLGLTISKTFMDALGGSISAKSPIANDKGTRLTLVFPRPAAADQTVGDDA